MKKSNQPNEGCSEITLLPLYCPSRAERVWVVGLIKKELKRLSDARDEQAIKLFFEEQETYIIRVNGSSAGVLGLTHPAYRFGRVYMECTLCLARKYWGKQAFIIAKHICGLLFGSISKLKLQAKVYATNPYPRRLLRNLGFKKEGVLRAETSLYGVDTDVELYSMLETDLSQP